MSENTEKNRAHFNETASSYNSKYSKTIEQIVEEVKTRRGWIGSNWVEDGSEDEPSSSTSQVAQKSVRLLDYACGTGLVSRALAPYVTQCVGIDVSEGMVAEYNKGASNQDIPSSEMYAHVGNLLNLSDPNPSSLSSQEFFNFDVAAVGMGFHHFEDPTLAATRLAERLKVGGTLFIVDFLPHGHSHHNASHTVMHMGFSEEDAKRMFTEAGVGKGFEYVLVGKGVVFTHEGQEMKRSLFMARGTKG